jgi:hypothetical protein
MTFRTLQGIVASLTTWIYSLAVPIFNCSHSWSLYVLHYLQRHLISTQLICLSSSFFNFQVVFLVLHVTQLFFKHEGKCGSDCSIFFIFRSMNFMKKNIQLDFCWKEKKLLVDIDFNHKKKLFLISTSYI